ncbi:class I SAM-dependent methyltransferase [Magnetospirillum moscoviense]|uniref:Methyltransferase n=1 Tax=Magnetospirillum moscoviense TaxID=1437059 RepID=A0A178MYD1_9PROT|nr:class I SAM-dependent methyltransferase [Magnetospirillum moscoviense]OAN55035.1 hypothetical protein A6A05_00300 [Magnetospirillum moscoviense]
MSMRMRVRTTCRICGGSHLVRTLDLGAQPPSNSFLAPADIAAEQAFPLEMHLCTDCGLSQLVHIVYSEDIFDEYLYLSSTSRALCQHYQGLIDGALARFDPPAGALAVDIGCNDGIMLRRYPEGRCRLLGIEPSSAGKCAREAGFEVIDQFFEAGLAERLATSHGRAALITATNVFAHVDDIASFAAGVRTLLADDGVFIIEFPYLVDMVERLYFDTIYHEHLCYLALTPLDHLFAKVGLRAFRVERTEVGASGPALRLFVCRAESARATEDSITAMRADEQAWGITDPARYRDFAARVERIRDRILALIAEVKAKGGRVGAYGAPAKGNTLLNYLKLGPSDIEMVAENNALKVGKVTPGSHIPIVGDDSFLASGIDTALLLTWNYLDFFLGNSDFIKKGGKFIVPLPDVKIVP